MKQAFLTAAKRHPVLWAVAVCTAVELGLNGVFGWRWGGGFPVGFFYGAASIAIGVVGAYFAHEIRDWRSPQTTVACVLALTCFAYTQVAGWRIMGVTMADNSVARSLDATKTSTVLGQHEGRVAARKALGDQPAPASVSQQIAAQLDTVLKSQGKTIREATRECADPLPAPKTCGEVNKLKVKLADAERAAELDQQIAGGVAALGGVKIVAAGDPDLAIVASILTKAGVVTTKDDVGRWLPVFVVALLGFISIFGWRLVLGAPGRPLEPEIVEYGGPYDRPPPRMLLAGPRSPGGASPSTPDGPASSGGGSGQTSLSGAPINITVGVPASVQGITELRAHGGAPVAQATATPEARARTAARGAENHAPPVDRAPMQQIADGLLAFRSACLAHAPGDLVGEFDLYRRYALWRGTGALAPAAFHALFAEVAGVGTVDVAGVRHYRNIALRAQPALAVAG